MKLNPDAKPMSCHSLKVLFALQYQFKQRLAKLEAQRIIELAKAGLATNALPLVWQRKKD